MYVLFCRALQQYQSLHDGSLPQPGNMEHAREVVQLTAQLNEEFGLVTDLAPFDVLLQQLALGASGLISPICALTGGILAQEVLKACSGKFMPITQWFYFDAAETLPDPALLSMEDVAPRGCRYDSQIAIYGKDVQDKLSCLNTFLVGAGAIGCEMIKNWAMMGISTSPDSMTHVTDMDLIEKSNLSRQFLFRFKDINCLKSTCAVNAAKAMNSSFSSVAYESKVAPDTEHFFNDQFYESLDFVCTALDNVEARLYIDQRCMFYNKPMLESGTLGTKGHTQVVVPHLTENYGATRDPPEKSIPVCTLKHFPNLIEHTLQWAREWFEEVFKQTAEDCSYYASSSTLEEFKSSYLDNQQNMKLSTLHRMHDALVLSRPTTFSDCVSWARLKFEEMFSNSLLQLLHNFPLDRVTSTGAPFWGGAKKPPSPIRFDIEDPLHFSFLRSLAGLRASSYSVEAPSDDALEGVIREAVSSTVVPPFRPKEGVKIAVTEEEAKGEGKGSTPGSSGGEDARPMGLEDIEDSCDRVLASLPQISSFSGNVISPIDFDKDIDAHMLVVSCVSNLRARNYAIPEADLHTSRGIAGKITPAIATTTALVTGAICLEIFKIIQNFPVEKLFNSFNNLALPMFTTMEPEPPKVTETVVCGKPLKWTSWDRVDIQNPDMTLKELIAFMDSEYQVELTMLSSGVSILYSDFMNRKKMNERMGMKVRDVVVSVTKKELVANQKYIILEMITNDKETDEEVELPYLRFKLFE
jgi:ubiquitin-activating enzyme E1